MKIIYFLTIFILSWHSIQQQAWGKVYECQVKGQTLYTSQPQKHCKASVLPKIGRYSMDMPSAPVPTPATDTVTPQQTSENTNKTAKTKHNKAQQSNTQHNKPASTHTAPTYQPSGKDGRIRILQEELNNEHKALKETQNKLNHARQNKQQAQIDLLNTQIQDRQHNIRALQQELNRMK